MFNDKWLLHGYFTVPGAFGHMLIATLEKDPSENAPAGIQLVQQISFRSIVNGTA